MEAMSDSQTGTSIWIPAEARDKADRIVRHLQQQPGQYGVVTRSSVIRAALELLARELGLDPEEPAETAS